MFLQHILVELVSQNKTINCDLPHGTCTEFAILSLSNFPHWGSSAGECGSQCQLMGFVSFPRPEWWAKVNVFAQGGDTSRSKVYQRKRKSSFSTAPMEGQWIKMKITTGQCCWPQSLCNIQSFFHLHIFAPPLCVFTPNRYNGRLRVTWKSNDKKYQ